MFFMILTKKERIYVKNYYYHNINIIYIKLIMGYMVFFTSNKK